MDAAQFWSKLRVKYKRQVARHVFRQPFRIQTDVPLISFTFDDFPESSLSVGGAILKDHGLLGTYYTALGLMGKKDTPTGTIFEREDLDLLLEQGHELASHTFTHCNAWETSPESFEESIVQNEVALRELRPDVSFRTLSYPVDNPRPGTKRRASRHFACCRAGGQTFNQGVADLNLLRAYFLDRDRCSPQQVRSVIDGNQRARGWLIFATHDISRTPTRFGCTPELFLDVVRYSVNSGARILPITRALETLRGSA